MSVCGRCESLTELILANRQQVHRVQMQRQQLPIPIPDTEPDLMPYLVQTIGHLIETLVTRSVVLNLDHELYIVNSYVLCLLSSIHERSFRVTPYMSGSSIVIVIYLADACA